MPAQPRIWTSIADIPQNAWFRPRWTGQRRSRNWVRITSYDQLPDDSGKWVDVVSVGDSRWKTLVDLFNDYEWCRTPGKPIFRCTVPATDSPQPKVVIKPDNGNSWLIEE